MTWERAGAASGIAAAILFLAAFVVFLAQDPSGAPRIPDIANAPEIGPYIDAHRDSMRVEALLSSLGIVAFLWFLGSLWSHLRAAEGGPARVSAIASAGGIVGAGAVLAGMVFIATALLIPSDVAPLPYALSAVSIGLGGAAFTVFFAAAGKVIVQTGALPVVIGALAFVAALAAALGFVTLFADSGVFNAATGAFGYWVRFGAFVIWLLVASVALTVAVGNKPATRRR
jgi:hypothetical protein